MPSVRCAGCDASLRLPESLRPGANVRCPRCGNRFRLPDPQPLDAVPVDAPKPAAPKTPAAGADVPRKPKPRAGLPPTAVARGRLLPGLLLVLGAAGLGTALLVAAMVRWASGDAWVDAALRATSPAKPPPAVAFPQPFPPVQGQPQAEVVFPRPPGPPIPQDVKVRQARRAEREAAARRDFVDAYERIGRKDPRWDAPARKAVAGMARRISLPVEAGGDAELQVWLDAKAAVDAGCDDPLVRYLYSRFRSLRAPGQPPPAFTLSEAAAGMRGSRYAAQLRYVALLSEASERLALDPTPEGKKGAGKLLGECLALLPEALRDGPPTRDRAYAMAASAVDAHNALLGDRAAAFARVEKVLDGDPSRRALLLRLKGHFLTNYAWDARGDGPGAQVGPEASRLFEERLNAAEAALTEAADLDPADGQAPALMITVCMGLGHERPEMENWFRRALEADPDNCYACLCKLTYLEPKWHGSVEEVLEFGQQCLATGNWDSGIPFVLLNAHQQLAQLFPSWEAYSSQMRSAWPDVQSVLDGYLREHPRSRYARSLYVKYNFQVGRYAEADRLLRELGDDAHPAVLRPAEMEIIRKEAKARAR